MEAVLFALTRPCVNCPFRRGKGRLFAISPARLAGIRHGPAFQCHKTVDYSNEDPASGDKPQQCAGLMAVLHRSGEPNQIMQVASRLGHLDLDALDPDGVAYSSWVEAVAAHGGREP